MSLERYTLSGEEHPMDEADVALAHMEISAGDCRLVHEGVLTLEKARQRKANKPRGGWPVDLALHRAQISIDSYKKVLREELTLSEAKEAGRDHVDAADAVKRAAEKTKGKKQDITVEGTEDPKGTGLVIGDEVYIRARAELVGGPNKALMVWPVAVGEWEIDPKHIIYAYKTDFFKVEDRNAPEPVVEDQTPVEAGASGYALGEVVWMKCQIKQGAEGLDTAVPYIEGKLPPPKKMAMKGVWAHKAELRREMPESPEPEEKIVEVAPEKSRVKQEFEQAYRALWEMDANASANGSRDGSDSAGVQIAMSELQKLSRKLRLGIKFGELDKQAQQTKE